MRRSSRPNDSFGELAAQEPTTDFLAPTGTVFPDPRLVAAIVDRVTFNAHIVETGTQSYRLATSKTSNRKRAS
jgi:IstB-like ATP binding protein